MLTHSLILSLTHWISQQGSFQGNVKHEPGSEIWSRVMTEVFFSSQWIICTFLWLCLSISSVILLTNSRFRLFTLHSFISQGASRPSGSKKSSWRWASAFRVVQFDYCRDLTSASGGCLYPFHFIFVMTISGIRKSCTFLCSVLWCPLFFFSRQFTDCLKGELVRLSDHRSSAD